MRGRRFPARAKFRVYHGRAKIPHDYAVDVIWETPSSFKIRVLEKTPMPQPFRVLEPGKTEMVPKRSIVFV